MEDSKIWSNVVLRAGDVELNINVNEDLTGNIVEGQSNGYITVHNSMITVTEIFWDNLDFFIECSKKDFKKECKEELKKFDYDWKEVYKTVKLLLGQAKKLELLN